jgi:hypothetical protein
MNEIVKELTVSSKTKIMRTFIYDLLENLKVGVLMQMKQTIRD